jgi:protein subunit release factor B
MKGLQAATWFNHVRDSTEAMTVPDGELPLSDARSAGPGGQNKMFQ